MPRLIHEQINLDDALTDKLVLTKKTLILFYGALGSSAEAAYEEAKDGIDDKNQMALMILFPAPAAIPEAAVWFGGVTERYVTLAAKTRKVLDSGDVSELNDAAGDPSCMRMLKALGGKHP